MKSIAGKYMSTKNLSARRQLFSFNGEECIISKTVHIIDEIIIYNNKLYRVKFSKIRMGGIKRNKSLSDFDLITTLKF